MKQLAALLFGLALIAVGAIGGFLAHQHIDDDAHVHAEDEADDHDHEDLEPETLANLGVEIGEIAVGSHTVTRTVHGVVGDLGQGQRPLSSPFGGVVREVHVVPGQMVGADEVVLEVLRDDLPVPGLPTTARLVAPLDEDLHRLYLDLRRATRTRDLAQAEVDRLAGLTGDGMPLVSAEQRIAAERVLALAQQDVANARGELHVHGFSEQRIAEVVGGGHPVRDQQIRVGALREHGLWGEAVAQVFELLPAEAREQGWTVAALGELQAQGLWTGALREAFVEVPELRERFREAVSLLLAGVSVERLRSLAAGGGLGPVVRLRAPLDAPDWDVGEVLARPGQRVDAGAVLARLERPDEMWLVVQPVGDEIAALQQVLAVGAELEARPLVVGAGPAMTGLRLQRLAAAESSGARSHLVAYVRLANESLPGGDGGRSWALRPGTRYALRLPVETFDNVFVLPRDALTSRGPDRIGFEAHGSHFHDMVVRVLHEDDEVVVLPVDGSPFKPGDSVVVRGAFALAQAMQLEGGGGHGHAHPH